LYLSKFTNSIFNAIYIFSYKAEIKKLYLNTGITLKGTKDQFIKLVVKENEQKKAFRIFSFFNKN
jgi:hypothetical protein